MNRVNCSDDFRVRLTDLGICYTFNGDHTSPLSTSGTGYSHASHIAYHASHVGSHCIFVCVISVFPLVLGLRTKLHKWHFNHYSKSHVIVECCMTSKSSVGDTGGTMTSQSCDT